MGMLKEFREFAVKGNVVDLAVGVIVGAAFGKIVDSLVKDVVMPVVGLLVGKLDFSSQFVVLGTIPEGVPRTLADLAKAGVPVLAWGNFATVVVNGQLAGTEAFGEGRTKLDFGLHRAVGEGLAVGVADGEIHPANALVLHVVDGVRAAAAYAYNLDRRRAVLG